MRIVPLIILAVLIAAPLAAQASAIVEPVLGKVCALARLDEEERREHCTYQYDGGHHGSASNDCAKPFPAIAPGRTSGFLAPVEDPEDNYAFNVSDGDIGMTFHVNVRPAQHDYYPSVNPDNDILAPMISVFAPDYEDESALCSVQVGERFESDYGSLVAFTPEWPGTYSLRVTMSMPGTSAGDDRHVVAGESSALPNPLEPAVMPMRCHPMCMGTLTLAVGYDITLG